jgi:hypothetical protein
MIQVPLDNLAKTRQYLAEKILNLIQTFYTEERVIQVTNEDDPLQPREPMVINFETPEGDIINNLTLGEYDVIVSSAPARDSFDETQFAEALSLRQAGVAIPDDAIVTYSHLQKKEELAKRIRVMTGQEPPTPEQAQVIAFQQQMAMQNLQLETMKLQAEVEKLQTESAVNVAKVQEVAEVSPQVRMAELQAKIQMNQEQLQLRRELSAATNDIRIGQSETSAATKIATTAMQQARSQEPRQ